MQTHGVTVRTLRALCGPNLYAAMPVLLAELDIGSYEERPSSDFPGLVERLTAWLPGLAAHTCSLGRPGGFIERLRRGTYLAHITEHVTLELQGMLGFDVSFGRARGTGEPGVYRVIVAFREEELGRAAFATALGLTLAAMHDEPFDITAELEQLTEVADQYRLGPSTAAIVNAARKRRIPVLRLTPTRGLVQLGYGIYQKRIQASETSTTSAIAVDTCQDKALTNHLLRVVGVPVPEGRTVTSADEAWEAAQDIGLPVVVKPVDGHQGKGVSVDLRTEADVRAAYHIADDHGTVLVERFITGDDYRLLVVGGALVAAARRDPAHVVGDGKRTVTELVAETNRDPRRGAGHGSVMTRITLDKAARLVLAQQGLAETTVPEPGQVVRLRSNSNLSTGGTATDVTELVHPANARVAELAAQILALDVAGVDVLCADITRPLAEQGGAIVEVNAAPGLRMHLAPAEGQPRDVGAPIVAMLYPDGAPSRIPIVAVTGTNGKTTVTRLIAHLYETARTRVGMTTTEGVYIGGERIIAGDCSGPQSARAVLLHPYVAAAVLETARGGILREGLAFDRCTVAVVTNVSADHLGLRGVETLRDLAAVKQVVVEAVDRNGAAVLNADDPLVAEMAAACDGQVVYFSRSPRSHVMAAHLAAGGRGVTVDHGSIWLHADGQHTQLIELERVAFTAGGAIDFQVANALAASAAAWAAGLNPALIARGLSTFATDARTVPGRFNVSDLGGVQVVLDYAHNHAAVQALGQAVHALGARRTVLVFTLAGDRRDDDLRRATAAVQHFADVVVLYDSHHRRGRAPGEIPQLLASFLPADLVAAAAHDQRAAITAAWQLVRPGDRLVVVSDIVEDGLEQLQALASSVAEDATCGTDGLREREVGM
jgi:cyanophycin synthetase